MSGMSADNDGKSFWRGGAVSALYSCLSISLILSAVELVV
jgi:hypothetical protein